MTTLYNMLWLDVRKSSISKFEILFGNYFSLLNASRISHLIELVTDQSNIAFDTVRFK